MFKKILAYVFLQPSSYSRWNWRLLGSLYLSLSFNEDDFNPDLDSDKNTTAAYAVNQHNVPVTLDAKLDASYDQSYVDQTTDEHHRSFEWMRLSQIKADRKLQCTVTSLQPGELNFYNTHLGIESKNLVNSYRL